MRNIKELDCKIKVLSKSDDFYDEYELYFKDNIENIKKCGNDMNNNIINLNLTNVKKINQEINKFNNLFKNKLKKEKSIYEKTIKKKDKIINDIEYKLDNNTNIILKIGNKKYKIINKTNRAKNHKPTGFTHPRPVKKKLADFIGIKAETELSGPQITSKVWDKLKERNLVYEKDKRVLRVDDEVSKLFNIPISVNKSTSHKDRNGFNFDNLQCYIKRAMQPEEENYRRYYKKIF